jgi:hypothetical protein
VTEGTPDILGISTHFHFYYAQAGLFWRPTD